MTSLPKGVYRQRKTLKDGRQVTYYRWRATGARIEGEPGTSDFDASLARAKTGKPRETSGTWASLVETYRRSPNYREMKPTTQTYYDRQLARVKNWRVHKIGDIKRARVLEIRDAIAIQSSQAANQFVMVLNTVLNFAVDRGFIDFNPLSKIKRIKGGTHATWSEDQIAYALKRFIEIHRRAVVLALYTGQREGDCCRMRWSQYDGSAVAVVQEKTGAEVWIPAHKTLKKELDAWRAESKGDFMLTNSLGRPWPTHSFAVTISGAIKAHPHLSGLVFHGLRKAAAVRLAEAGCSTREIASITGHETLAMVELYTRAVEQKRMARAAIRKLELVRE